MKALMDKFPQWENKSYLVKVYTVKHIHCESLYFCPYVVKRSFPGFELGRDQHFVIKLATKRSKLVCELMSE